MNCIIRCGQNIELIGMSAKLIGGYCLVGKNITATVIGTPSNLSTELVLGTEPKTMSRFIALKKDNLQLKTSIDKLSQVVTLLSQYEAIKRLTPDKQKMLDNSRFSLKDAKTKLDKTAKRLNF